MRLTVLGLVRFVAAAGHDQLISLSLFFNQFTNLILPPNLPALSVLDLEGDRFSSFNVPSNLKGAIPFIRAARSNPVGFNPLRGCKLTFAEFPPRGGL